MAESQSEPKSQDCDDRVDTAAALRQFLSGRFPGMEIPEEDDILAMGFVNSLFVMEMVMFIERLVGRRIPNNELRMPNFRSINAMVALVDRLHRVTEGVS